MADIEIKGFIEKYVKEWMFRDIEQGIKNNSNFLVALGLMTYTEILGGVIRCIQDDAVCDKVFARGNSKINFNACFKELGNCYEKVAGEDPYINVRSGIVHQYFIKFKGAIVTNNQGDPDGLSNTYSSECGLYKGPDGRMNLITNIYFRDLRNRVDMILQNLDKTSSKKICVELIETQTVGNFNTRQFNMELTNSLNMKDNGISVDKLPPNTSAVDFTQVAVGDKLKKESGVSNE